MCVCVCVFQSHEYVAAVTVSNRDGDAGITWQHRYSYCTGGDIRDGDGYGAYKEKGAQHSLLDLHKQQEVSLHPQPFRMDQCVMPIGEVLEVRRHAVTLHYCG